MTGHSSNISSHTIRTSLLRIHLPLLLIQGLFAIIPTTAKIAFRVFSPEAVVFFRIAGSALLFSLFYFPFFREPITEKKHYLYFAVFGLFGVAGNQFLFIKGVSYTTATNASTKRGTASPRAMIHRCGTSPWSPPHDISWDHEGKCADSSEFSLLFILPGYIQTHSDPIQTHHCDHLYVSVRGSGNTTIHIEECDIHPFQQPASEGLVSAHYYRGVRHLSTLYGQ